MDQKTRELIAQAELLLEQFQQTLALYEGLIRRTHKVGRQIEQRIARVLCASAKDRHNPDNSGQKRTTAPNPKA